MAQKRAGEVTDEELRNKKEEEEAKAAQEIEKMKIVSQNSNNSEPMDVDPSPEKDAGRIDLVPNEEEEEEFSSLMSPAEIAQASRIA